MTFSHKLATLLLPFLLWSLLPGSTTAQPTGPPCAFRREVIAELLSRYREQPVALGLQHDGTLLEVLASPQGSWTILVTAPNRVSCVRASGVAWEMMRAAPNERGVMLPK